MRTNELLNLMITLVLHLLSFQSLGSPIRCGVGMWNRIFNPLLKLYLAVAVIAVIDVK